MTRMTRRGNAPALLWVVLGLVLSSFALLVVALATSRTGWAWGSVGASGVAAGLLVADWLGRRRIESDTPDAPDTAEAATGARSGPVVAAQWAGTEAPTEIYALHDREPAEAPHDLPAPGQPGAPSTDAPSTGPAALGPAAAPDSAAPDSREHRVTGPGPAGSDSSPVTDPSATVEPPPAAAAVEPPPAAAAIEPPPSPAATEPIARHAAPAAESVDAEPAGASATPAAPGPATAGPASVESVVAEPGEARRPRGRGLGAAGAVAAVLPRGSSARRTSLRRPSRRPTSTGSGDDTAAGHQGGQDPAADRAGSDPAMATLPEPVGLAEPLGTAEPAGTVEPPGTAGTVEPPGTMEPAGTAAAGDGVGKSRSGYRRPGDQDVPDQAIEPREEQADAADAITAASLSDEVVVIDERPRYHLRGCVWVGARETLPLPLREARDLGFGPCSVCRPDATLAARHRARRS
jgi:hypothetical protein